MSFVDGEQVGPYRVIEQLGRGGMATVYKAYHASLDRYVALKVLHPAFLEDPGFKARFEREAKVVARLEHANIIPIYDYSEHQGNPFLVMKFVEGETLKGRITRQALTPAEGLQVIKDVGQALTYAHGQGILHRDVKPSNVILGEDGRVYLTDFGLARIASAGESTLSSDMMLGTPQYISPEQAMGLRDLDEGTDIYSLGVLIYELTVGQVPFSADTPFSIVHDHIYKPLPLPRAVNPNVPESVERVLLKALSKERSDRFESIQELVDHFQRAVEGEDMPEEWSVAQSAVSQANAGLSGTATPPPSAAVSDTGSQARKKKRRRRWLWAIPLLLVLCFAAVVILGALSDAQNPGGTPTAQVESEPTLDPTQAALDARIQRVESLLDEDPDNPLAYLDLSMAYYDADQQEDAQEAFATAEELAGEDADFFVTAGDAFAQREEWALAVTMYSTALNFGYDANAIGFKEKFSKALYYAASDNTLRDLFFTDLQEDSRLLSASNVIALRARYLLLAEDSPVRANDLVSSLRQRSLDTPLSNLVLAETWIVLEQYDEATPLLEALISEETAADIFPWMRVEARHLLDLIP
jgi:predicted Ser/Thr protein kinase/tetratricopeptide (TPR) repeat protein